MTLFTDDMWGPDGGEHVAAALRTLTALRDLDLSCTFSCDWCCGAFGLLKERSNAPAVACRAWLRFRVRS